ncbi:MAG: hypothetical protein HS127_15610 [Planctomycetia bacterium]|nr:hypothetical protein [Planctomycetia bacterium]
MSYLPFGDVYPQDRRRVVYGSLEFLMDTHDIHIKIDLKLLNTYPVKTSFAFILLYVFEAA